MPDNGHQVFSLDQGAGRQEEELLIARLVRAVGGIVKGKTLLAIVLGDETAVDEGAKAVIEGHAQEVIARARQLRGADLYHLA